QASFSRSDGDGQIKDAWFVGFTPEYVSASSYPIHKAETYSGVNPTNQASFICQSPSERLAVPVFPGNSYSTLPAVVVPSLTTLCSISVISQATCEENIFSVSGLAEATISPF